MSEPTADQDITYTVLFVDDEPNILRAIKRALFSMNIKQSTLFPGLDGLARSMEYELEYNSWVNTKTGKLSPTLRTQRAGRKKKKTPTRRKKQE